MTQPFDLTQLDPASFENMVNHLALTVLGNGTTGFAPGPDGGRDGYFEGEAPYPSATERWSGSWYIQSKFHKPALSKNSQTWLQAEVKKEIDSYLESGSSREIPDVWIVATNIDPSAVARTGTYDKIKKDVTTRLGKKIKFDIWGGRKILDFLSNNPNVADYYGHFLTPGHVLTALQRTLIDSSAQIEAVIKHFIISNFNEQVHTKLEQAGPNSDTRPKIHDLFIDLPFNSDEFEDGLIFESLIASAATPHRISVWNDFGSMWQSWARNPRRSRVVVVKGGPGQGKSTIGQYFAQIQRAALILSSDGPSVTPAIRAICRDLKEKAEIKDYWPKVPRIPVTIELKDFAKWYGAQAEGYPLGVLSYLSARVKSKLGEDVFVGTFKRALKHGSWFITFDGLDEVPNDVKDHIANEIIEFTNELIPDLDADVLILCTTRPQGYSGQFERIDAATVVLSTLTRDTALECASAVVSFGRTPEESESAIAILENALNSEQVRELMTTPLQSHIMAVLVRDGGRPPEKRWQLFENFYQVMKKRETLKGFGDPKVARLLSDSDTLLRAIHSRLGISLHAQAENSSGAETTLPRKDFRELAVSTTNMLVEENVEEIIDALMEATTERLVFVNTPDDNQSVRFDIRQLQEFFAGEFIYSGIELNELEARIKIIGSDSHWREVMHFMLSALVVANRQIELTVAIDGVKNLDFDTECHDLSFFKHRTSAGAGFALRLLNEGVLEQDRRIRGKFSAAMIPVFATLDPRTIDTLSSITHPNSNAWLMSTMIDALTGLSESEHIAAAIALSRILPGDHPRIDEVKKQFFASSTPYLNYVIEANNLTDRFPFSINRFPEVRIADWFIEGILKLVISWKTPLSQHDDIDLTSIFNLLRFHSEKTLRVIRNFDIELRPYLIAFIQNNDPQLPEVSAAAYRKSSSLVCIPYIAKWEHESALPPLLRFGATPATIAPIFKVVDAIISFAKSSSHRDYLSLVEILLDYQVSPTSIPLYIQALVPLNFNSPHFQEDLKAHQSITLDELKVLLADRTFRGEIIKPPYKMMSLLDFSLSTWQTAIDKMPNLALDLWFSHHEYIHQDELMSPAYRDRVFELAMTQPSYFSGHVLAWGKLIGLYPTERDKILSSLLKFSFNSTGSFIKGFPVYPFQLNLPEEALVLVPLAEAIIELEEINFTKHPRRFRDANLVLNEATLSGFGLTVQILDGIYNDATTEISIRRAALSIYLCHEFTTPPNDALKEHILEIYRSLLPGSPRWYVLSGIVFHSKNVTMIDSSVSKFIGQLLSRFRNDYLISASLQSLVVNWRERSTAPVARHSALRPWLAHDISVS